MEKEHTPQIFAELVHYYEVRMVALTEYSTRIWNRFNWFLTLQLAIFGFYFTRLESLPKDSILIIPSIGIVIAILWIFIGKEDYHSMKRHGKVVTELDLKIRNIFSEQTVNFDPKPKKSFFRFRQMWVLFLFPIIVAISWVFFIV